MRSTPSLPSIPGPLWPGVVVPNRVLSKGQIELFDIQTVYFNIQIEYKQMIYAKLNCLKLNCV